MTTLSWRSLAPLSLAATLVMSGCGLGGPEQDTDGDYPSQDVRVVVPFDAGGPASLIAQAGGDCLSEELGQTFVIENLPGGSGAIGMTEVSSAEPDGYTLGIGSIGNMVIGPRVNESSQFTREDFTPIGKVYDIPSVVAVRADSPYKTAKELFAAATQTPGALSMATPGATTMQNTELRRLAAEHGAEFNLVPFDGVADAVTAVLGGNADGMFIDVSESVQQLADSGQIRILATGTEEPVDFLEGVPTLPELGYPELTNSTVFFAFVAPAGTPEDVIDTLAGTLESCLEDEEVRSRLTEELIPAEFAGPDQVAEDIDAADAAASEVLGQID